MWPIWLYLVGLGIVAIIIFAAVVSGIRVLVIDPLIRWIVVKLFKLEVPDPVDEEKTTNRGRNRPS